MSNLEVTTLNSIDILENSDNNIDSLNNVEEEEKLE